MRTFIEAENEISFLRGAMLLAVLLMVTQMYWLRELTDAFDERVTYQREFNKNVVANFKAQSELNSTATRMWSTQRLLDDAQRLRWKAQSDANAEVAARLAKQTRLWADQDALNLKTIQLLKTQLTFERGKGHPSQFQ